MLEFFSILDFSFSFRLAKVEILGTVSISSSLNFFSEFKILRKILLENNLSKKNENPEPQSSVCPILDSLCL